MHDSQSQLANAWQNVVCIQPRHPGFYLGVGINPLPQALDHHGTVSPRCDTAGEMIPSPDGVLRSRINLSEVRVCVRWVPQVVGLGNVQ